MVGKYRYFMVSPAEAVKVPVIVDIILVGRTKIITLHSCVWLENQTAMLLHCRCALHSRGCCILQVLAVRMLCASHAFANHHSLTFYLVYLIA